MDIDLLRSFIAICDTGSFTAAARLVGRTQSAVSLQMRRLEDSLDRPLFFRGASSVTLTEHGEMLQGHAREILASVDLTLAAFDRSSPAGIVVIGIPEDYALKYAPRILDSTFRLFPKITVDLVIGESRSLVRHLSEGSVDLAFITEGEGPSSGGPVAFHDRISWVGPAEGDLHLRDPLPVAVWNDEESYSRALFEALEKLGRRHCIAVVSQSVTGLQAAVMSGHAISVVVGSAIQPGMRELTVADGFPPLRPLQIRLERAHRRRSPVVDRLAGHLAQGFTNGPQNVAQAAASSPLSTKPAHNMLGVMKDTKTNP